MTKTMRTERTGGQGPTRPGRYRIWLHLLGRGLATLGVLNLVRKTFDLGLASVFRTILDWYEVVFIGLLAPLIDAVSHLAIAWFDWTPPSYFEDLFVLYFIFGAANLRALDAGQLAVFLNPRMDDWRHKLVMAVDTTIRVLFWPVHVFAGPVIVIYDYLTIRYVWKGYVRYVQLLRSSVQTWGRDFSRFLREFLYVLGAFMIFLLANAGLSDVERQSGLPGSSATLAVQAGPMRGYSPSVSTVRFSFV